MSVRHAAPVFLIAIALLSLLILNAYAAVSITSIPCIITKTNTSINTCIASTIPLAFLGILVSLMITGLIYIIGTVINYERLKGLYRDEMWETAKSLIIIAIIFSSLAVSSAIAAALVGANSSPKPSAITTNLASVYTAADTNYLVPQLADAERSFSGLLGLSVGTDLLRSLTISPYLPIPIWTPWTGVIGSVDFGANVKLFAATNYITQVYGTPSLSLATGATDIVTVVLLSLQVQHDLIYIIAALGLGVLIPVGIIMRSIPFIRGIGGTLIALGIGLSIVYPALLVGFNMPISNYMFSISPPQTQATFTCGAGRSWINFNYLMCEMFTGSLTLVNGIPGYLTGQVPFSIAFGPTTYSSVPGVSALAASGFWTGALGPIGFIPPSINDPNPLPSDDTSGGSIYPTLNFIVDVSLDQIIQFLLFAFDIIIGFAVTNGIANLLGGKITPGVGRFKLA